MEPDTGRGTTQWATEAVRRASSLAGRAACWAATQTKLWMGFWLAAVLVGALVAAPLHAPIMTYVLMGFILVLAASTGTKAPAKRARNRMARQSPEYCRHRRRR